MKLFQPKNLENLSENDPIMINPRGMSVRVPESQVVELLKKGFVLEDRGWRPTPVERPIDRTEPISLAELEEEMSAENDALEVTEI